MSDLPDRFPRGWFVLGHERDFPAGETKTIYGFDSKINVTRDESNSVSVDVGGDKSWPTLEQNQMLMIWHDHHPLLRFELQHQMLSSVW